MPRTITQYYTTIKHQRYLYDRKKRQMPAPADTAEKLLSWQKQARKKLWELLGLDLMETCELNPTVVETEEFEDYIREKVVIQSAPYLYNPLTVLVPKKEGKHPVFLHSFGHGSEYSNTCAYRKDFVPKNEMEKLMTEMPGIGPAGFKQLAKEGYLVVIADSRGSGERQDFKGLSPEFMNCGADNPLNNVATAMGLCKVGMEVWDLMRMTDYVQSREDCSGHIGVGGVSGGGHQSLFFAALDERVEAVVSSAWFYGFKDALIELPHNCSCNFVPHLFEYFDISDLGSMIAPRALEIETGMSDMLNSLLVGIGNVIEPYDQTLRSYELLGAKEKLWHSITDGGHGGETGARTGEDFAPFLHKYLRSE